MLRWLALAALVAGCHDDAPKVAPAAPAAPADWSYTSTDWAHGGYPECGGAIESPIAIDSQQTLAAALPPLELHYASAQATVTDTGHTIVAKPAGANAIVVDGETLPLVQFHFHHASEHTIDGAGADLELHLVHQDARGHTVVVAILVKSGAPHAELGKMLDHLPTGSASAQIQIDPSAFLPADRRYFQYTGSLTAPPCTEGVDWLVLRAPIEVSPAQIAAFAARYPNNARPLQPLDHRVVLASP